MYSTREIKRKKKRKGWDGMGKEEGRGEEYKGVQRKSKQQQTS